MKKLIFLLLISVSASAQVQTYTISPTTRTFAFNSSFGLRITRPLNSIYLQYTLDSQKVKVISIYDGDFLFMSAFDSIKHFYSGTLHITTRTQFDSFFKASLVR